MSFTGFIAYAGTGEELAREKNLFYDERLKRVCATNWHQIDKSEIFGLSLWWGGEQLKIFQKEPHPWEWVFYHTGCFDAKTGTTTIMERTIGFKTVNKAVLFTVEEKTGKHWSEITFRAPK